VEAQAVRRSIPTDPQPTDIRRQVRSRLARRLFVAALGLFLLLGALGVYGVRTRTVSAAGGGYELSVRYASVSRPGLATPWSLEVRRPGGFPDGVTVAVMSSYFDVFDENGLDPAPVEETSDGERTFWTFGPSTADTISVSFDARIEPGVQVTRAKGQAEVLVAAPGPTAATAVSVEFGTWVMP
jgi:hypothetical protein